MIKRLWSASVLACALLLAADSILAKEDVDGAGLRVSKAADSSTPPRTPRPTPLDGGASPGDDDMPGRAGSGSSSPHITSMSPLHPDAPSAQGWRLREVSVGLRWYLMRAMQSMR